MNDTIKARVAAISREASRIRPADIAAAIKAKNLINKGEAGVQRGGAPGEQARQYLSKDFARGTVIDVTEGTLEHQDGGEAFAKPSVEIGHAGSSGVVARAYAGFKAAKTAFLNAWRAA